MAVTAVELCKVTKKNIARVVALQVHPDQTGFVADNAKSLAEAYVYGEDAWPRVICVDGEPVGFVMLYQAGPDHPEAKNDQADYSLWRLMIGHEHQNKGYGRAAVHAVIEHVKTLPGAIWLDVSYVPGEGCPEPFYRTLGFEPTGEVDGGEVVMRLTLK